MREVLLLGLRRAGKTSISRVVFGNMDPSQTQYLHATYAVTPTPVAVEALAKFTILDAPGQEDIVAKDIMGMRAQMKTCGALVFVLDCTDYSPSTGGGKRADYEEAINRLVLAVQQMHVVTEPNEVRMVDVFLHKADKLTNEHQRGVQEEVRQQLQFRLKGRLSAELESRRVVVQYHLTSIFDHSVFYAFSLVVRRVIPNILHIQSLMQVCCNNSHVLSYFLFGISRRMFIASANVSDDRRPSDKDVHEYECSSDMVDFFQSMHSFVENNRPNSGGSANGSDGGTIVDDHAAGDAPLITPSSPFPQTASFPGDVAPRDAVVDGGGGGSEHHHHHAGGREMIDTTPSAVFRFPGARPGDSVRPVYLVRQVGPLLTLVVGLKPENVDAMRPAIEYNICLLEKALMQVLKINTEILSSS